MRKIELFINVCDLGDGNTYEDNIKYANAVRNAIAAEYSSADITVELVDNISSSIFVSDDETGKIAESVNAIKRHVWERNDMLGIRN